MRVRAASRFLSAEVSRRVKRRPKGSPYSITERRITVLGSQPAGDVSHKPGGWLLLLSDRPAVTPASLKRVATSFVLGEQRHDWCEQFA